MTHYYVVTWRAPGETLPREAWMPAESKKHAEQKARKIGVVNIVKIEWAPLALKERTP